MPRSFLYLYPSTSALLQATLPQYSGAPQALEVCSVQRAPVQYKGGGVSWGGGDAVFQFGAEFPPRIRAQFPQFTPIC